jgi:hypothetical protein
MRGLAGMAIARGVNNVSMKLMCRWSAGRPRPANLIMRTGGGARLSIDSICC